MEKHSTTICAIASGLSESGIGIIRISGNESFQIASNIFKNKNGEDIDISKSHVVYYGYIFDTKENPNNKKQIITDAVDEVILLTMKSPRSFTKEDVIEIHAHGGLLILQKILNIVLKNGAVLAEAGEFTKRAFLNGRIDLLKAESIASFISSQNELAMKANFIQLKGDLSKKLTTIKNNILEQNAFIEAALDDPEHISLDGFNENLLKNMLQINTELSNLISTYNEGKIIKDGIKTVILGRPNAGKSSLLNSLLKRERAIVTSIAGTTRDTLEESINMQGFTLNIVDTAGIRKEENVDTIEKIGIDKALTEAKDADLILYIIDFNEYVNNKKINEDDLENIKYLKENNKNYIILLNKSDLISHSNSPSNIFNEYINKSLSIKPILTSAKKNIGIEELKNTITKLFFNHSIDYNNQLIITQERHFELLNKAKKCISNVIDSINNKLPEDFYTIDLMAAYSAISHILGEEVKEDLINEIFSKFCMGK